MNCIECFNRSRGRAACRSGASMVSGVEYYLVPPLRPSWCLDGARSEYYHRITFAPILVPRWCQVWSLTPCHLCARPGASVVPGVEGCTRVPLRPVWCLLCYVIYYTISQILELSHPFPFLATHYRPYRTSRIL